MKPVTKNQLAAFHALLKKYELLGEKRSIINDLSNGRCRSTKDLSFDELQSWINGMNAISPTQTKKGQRMINYIIAASHEMNWITQKQVINGDGSLGMKNDYSKMHQWIESNVYKKPLKDHSIDELTKLVTVIKKVNLSFLKKEK
jgi:hypothetical protein